jgi:inosine/xanthosine triphosphatase
MVQKVAALSEPAHLPNTTKKRLKRFSMKIAIGSNRAAKIMAVRSACARVAQIDATWSEANIISRAVKIAAPAMPLTDWEMMRGARDRAAAARESLLQENLSAQIYIGLEGGFHSISIDGEWRTFLRGWAYATDGRQESYGAAPSITVPEKIARRVVQSGRELGEIIDEVAGQQDVRSRQGAWGILSNNLLTRAMSFEIALIAAFAPFYNTKLYS